MHTVNASEKIQATKTQKILKLTLSTRSLVILATHTFKLVPLSGRAMLVCSQHGTSLKRANNFSSNVANRKNSKTYTVPTAAPLNRQQGHSFRLHQHHSSQIPKITRHQHQHHSSPKKHHSSPEPTHVYNSLLPHHINLSQHALNAVVFSYLVPVEHLDFGTRLFRQVYNSGFCKL